MVYSFINNIETVNHGNISDMYTHFIVIPLSIHLHSDFPHNSPLKDRFTHSVRGNEVFAMVNTFVFRNTGLMEHLAEGNFLIRLKFPDSRSISLCSTPFSVSFGTAASDQLVQWLMKVLSSGRRSKPILNVCGLKVALETQMLIHYMYLY